MTPAEYEEFIIKVPDFPKPGVIFKDISPLLQEKLPELIEDLGKGINWKEIDLVLGIESRGFILGSALALKNNKGFLPIRKKGKLPPPVVSMDYDLEYGSDTLEMSVNSKKLNVLIVDDVVATGGTLRAAVQLCKKNNFIVKDITALINLTFLNNLEEQNIKVKSPLIYK